MLAALLDSATSAHVGGRLAEAEALYVRVLAASPEEPHAHNNLGHLLAGRGDEAGALSHYRRAVQAAPQEGLFRNNLGAALLSLGQLKEAIVELRAAVAADPGSAPAHNNLGTALRRAGLLQDAVACHEQALRHKPDHASAHNNLGLALFDLGRSGEALVHFDRAIALSPDFAEAHANRAGPLLELGALPEAICAYDEALRQKPTLAAAHTGLLLALHYSEHHDAGAILEKSRRFAGCLADGLPKLPRRRDRDPHRPLRVAYLSPDLRDHAVAFFLEPLLCAHDRAQFTILGYADVSRPDAVTARLRGRCDHSRDVAALSDEALAALVQDDGIDVLVDLAGHTRRNRLLCFARRPAPVQVSYLGYPGTTGLGAMDLRLTDGIADPMGVSEGDYSERLWRLPGGFLCYRPPEDAPPVTPLPALATAALTFASCNNRPKITGPVLSAWAAILRALPAARLVLKSAGLGDATGQARLSGELARLGIDPRRVTMCGLVPDRREHLGHYGAVDIALDTFPYNGTTTTCEALWMGVPVVTLRGQRHAGRVGASLLTAVGLADLIADSEGAYVEKAVALGRDLGRLAALRAGLRERLRQAPLLDGQRLARGVEGAYRAQWRASCASTLPG